MVLKKGRTLSCLLALPLLLGALCCTDAAYAVEGSQDAPNAEVADEKAGQPALEESFGVVEDDLEPMLGVIDESLDPMRGDGQNAFSKGWNQIDGSWYWCAEANAAPSNGFVWVGSELYWLDPTRGGKMAVGMFDAEGKCYISDSSGRVKRSCWVDYEGSWYYATSSGALAEGWLSYGGTWYWLDPTTHVMRTGWIQLDDGWYWCDSSGAMATGWKRLNGTAYKFDQQGRWVSDTGSVLNVSRDRLVNWLWSHESDGYYVGTPYSSGFSIDTCTYPNGAPRWDGFTGMNCTGMVVHGYSMAGGVGDLGAIGATNSYSPWQGGPGGGSYINAWRWYGYAVEHGAEIYIFDTVADMLASGKAEKGDILFFKTTGSIDCHIGFFWGDTPYENKMWHQIYPRNLISTCFNNANKGELYQDTVLIKGC